MAKKEFKVFEDAHRQLDLIRVVDNLICGHRPIVLQEGAFSRVSSDIVQESFHLAAQCTNYRPPYQKRVAVQMAGTVARLLDLSMSFGAVSLKLPQSRYEELNHVFANIVTGLNKATGGCVLELEHTSYLPLLPYRSKYDDKKTPSMFSENARGIWAFQEHRQVA